MTEVESTEIAEYRQTALSEFPPSDEWFEDNITDMDRAERFGRLLLDIGNRTQISLGLLFLYVEKGKAGRGLNGGHRELARRLGVAESTARDYENSAIGNRKLREVRAISQDVPLAQLKMIAQSPEPDKTAAFIAARMENKDKPPLMREVSAFNRQIEREEKIERLSELPQREDIIHDSIENILDYLEPESVDLILTDPPYPGEFLPLWGILAQKAALILKPGGFLVAYSGHFHLPKVFAALSEYLDYVWTLALLHSGAHQGIQARRIHAGWKPILVYCNTPYEPQQEWMCDVINGSGREKEDHEWQQGLGEAEELITRFSLPKALVVDPFLGSGTTVLAAKNTGRSFFGMDVDELAVKTTLGRLAS